MTESPSRGAHPIFFLSPAALGVELDCAGSRDQDAADALDRC